MNQTVLKNVPGWVLPVGSNSAAHKESLIFIIVRWKRLFSGCGLDIFDRHNSEGKWIPYCYQSWLDCQCAEHRALACWAGEEGPSQQWYPTVKPWHKERLCDRKRLWEREVPSRWIQRIRPPSVGMALGQFLTINLLAGRGQEDHTNKPILVDTLEVDNFSGGRWGI